ncbi:MAG: hypothetical protein ACYC7E_22225 [Armatimonadota bacterium]
MPQSLTTAILQDGPWAALALALLTLAYVLVRYVMTENSKREEAMRAESLDRENRLVTLIDQYNHQLGNLSACYERFREECVQDHRDLRGLLLGK